MFFLTFSRELQKICGISLRLNIVDSHKDKRQKDAWRNHESIERILVIKAVSSKWNRSRFMQEKPCKHAHTNSFHWSCPKCCLQASLNFSLKQPTLNRKFQDLHFKMEYFSSRKAQLG